MIARPFRHWLHTMWCGIAAVLVLSTVAIAPAEATPPTLSRSGAAAGWLAEQLVEGERFETVFDGVAYPDQGLTIDAILAFAAAKVADTHATAATAWLSQPEILTGYIGDGTEAYAGATAKLALAVEVRGGDPTDFGGVDLIERLRGLQAASGRFSDRSAWGDYSNAFTQAFALLALDRTAAGAPETGAVFLAATRCSDGGYPLYFGAADCVSDVDATAMAVQALLAVDRTADAAPAVTWLLSVQAADGAFSNDTGVPNANSTGLAAQALRAAGRPLAWFKARGYLVSLQVGCSGAEADRGAIAYTADGFDPTTAVRATAQAVPGLRGASLATLVAAGSRPAAPRLFCP